MTPIPATYLGMQVFPELPNAPRTEFALWTIWLAIDGHPYGSTVSINTLTDAGYVPVESMKGAA